MLKQTISHILVIVLILQVVVLTPFSAKPVVAQKNDEPVTAQEILDQRQAIAAQLAQATSISSAHVSMVSADSLIDALDLNPALVAAANQSGDPAGLGVFASLGVITPQEGESFLLLSSGVAGSALPEPGADLAGNDQIQVNLTISVPVGISHISFSYNFLSAEYPDYIGSAYNDTFTAVLSDRNGVREIARASVNSSVFAPASASNAGGSGFDLFTPNPSGVDYAFGIGYPDAGVTGFKRINVEVEGGQQIILTFTVEDRGDSILDSAVILDKLSLGAVELVDPNPIFLQNGEIINNTETLAVGGRIVEGAAADGVTRLLLRGYAPFSGVAEFCLKDGVVDDDGGLAQIGEEEGRKECVTAPVQETSRGKIAYAIYQVPDEFNRGNDVAKADRPVGIHVKFSSTSGDVFEIDTEIKLVRPPVVLIHGLWSNRDTWTFGLVSDPRFKKHVVRADYKETNAAYFSTNLYVPLQFAGIALRELRAEGIAATQVDVAGHSMGGILSRNYVTSPRYKRSNNYNEGDFHKLFTLNTPHTGSPLGNLLAGLRDGLDPIKRYLLLKALKAIDHPIDEGAIDDLAKGSSAINAIQRTEVPAHALVGTGGSDLLAEIPGNIGLIYTVINFYADTSDLFQNLQHDGIVGRQSQEGGMSPNAYSVYGGLDTIHTSVTGYVVYSDRLIELLNTPSTNSAFDYFPAPATLPLVEAASLPLINLADGASSTTGITITAPIEGASFAAGSTISVMVDAQEGLAVNEVLLVTPDNAATDDVTPFILNVSLPMDYVGDYPLSATGKDSSGNLYGSNTVTITIVPTATLQSLDLTPDESLITGVGETRSLLLQGNYSDGVLRNLTSPSAGTFYLVSDPDILSVSTDGVITALKSGSATVIALNNGLQDSVSVQVSVPNELPFANAGTNQIGEIGTPVTLDGTTSNDPDAGPAPLTYEWFQISGPAVTLSDPNSSTPSFVPIQAGRYVFSLVARDGQDDSASDQVTVDVAITDVAVDIIAENQVSPGEPITYTIAYFNSGSILATDVVITNHVPISFTNISFTSSRPITVLGDSNYTWQIGNLPAGASETIVVHGTVQSNLPAGTNLSNEVVIHGATLDANGLNNQYANSFTVRNVKPVTQNAMLQLAEDSGLNGTLSATDANGDTVLTFSIVEQPHQGELVLNNSNFVYTPVANFNGNDSFTFVVGDSGGLTATATIALQVLPVNDLPNASNDAVSVPQDSLNNTILVLDNDSFAPDVNEKLQIATVGKPNQGGTVSIDPTQAHLIYTPKSGFVGSESFNYTINDGHGGEATAAVTVTVTQVTRTIYLPVISR